MIAKKFGSLVLAAVGAVCLAAGCSSSSSGTKVASGCKPAHQFSTLEKGKLTVTGEELPPFGHVTGSGVSGVDGDILTAIAKMECLQISGKPVAAAAVVPDVQSGRADVAMGDWNRTAARVKVVAMSDPIYIDQMALVSKAGYTQISQLKGHSVGTITGYLWVQQLQAYLGGSLKLYPSNVQMYADMRTGRLDVGVDGYGPGAHSAKGFKTEAAAPDKAVTATLTAPQTGFPISMGNSGLLSAVNADIATLKSNGQIVKLLRANGLPASAADTGAPRLVQ